MHLVKQSKASMATNSLGNQDSDWLMADQKGGVVMGSSDLDLMSLDPLSPQVNNPNAQVE